MGSFLTTVVSKISYAMQLWFILFRNEQPLFGLSSDWDMGFWKLLLNALFVPIPCTYDNYLSFYLG